jgi:hypothetical protein
VVLVGRHALLRLSANVDEQRGAATQVERGAAGPAADRRPVEQALVEGHERVDVVREQGDLGQHRAKRTRVTPVLPPRPTLRRMEEPFAVSSTPATDIEAQLVRRRLRVSKQVREAAPYLGAGVSYVAIGVFETGFLLSWIVAIGWLLLWTWGLPALVRKLRP